MKQTTPLPDLEQEPFVDVARSASVFGVDQRAIYRLIEEGQLQAVRVGRLYRVPTSELHKLAGRTLNS